MIVVADMVDYIFTIKHIKILKSSRTHIGNIKSNVPNNTESKKTVPFVAAYTLLLRSQKMGSIIYFIIFLVAGYWLASTLTSSEDITNCDANADLIIELKF